jgi:cytochrome c5
MSRNLLQQISALMLLALLASGTIGCRGTTSSDPPVHVVLNMDFQEKFEAQEANTFYEDGRAMRPPPLGTVARGMLRADTRFAFGRQPDGRFVQDSPVEFTLDVLKRGKRGYEVFCVPCHGAVGDGKGIIMTGDYGFVPAPSYHDDRLRTVEDGYLYDVIANGIRNMPAYGYQMTPEDRWAVVGYIRALQRSQNASAQDVPQEILGQLEQGDPNVRITD